MFGASPWEMIAIAVIALLIFGPDKLPKLAADAARLLREVRRMATGARQELKESLGPELGDLDLAELNPATFVKRNLLDPIDDEVKSVRKDIAGFDVTLPTEGSARSAGGGTDAGGADAGGTDQSEVQPGDASARPRFDADTT